MKRISKTEIKEMRSQSKKNSIMFAFTLPTVILYTIFFLVTMLIGVYYSFTDWNGISKDYTFVGLKNYVKLIRQIKERRYNYYLELKIWKRRIKINEKNISSRR